MDNINNYVIIKPIGQGGMSDVFLVRDKNSGEHYAMKQLRAERRKIKRSLVRFRREAALLAQLQHPNIIRVFDHGESGGSYCIIMEYIEGTNLKEKIHNQGPLHPRLAFNYLFQITSALVCAHEAGIVHRDIKPANILLTKDDKAILTDFGIAKNLDSETDFTKAGTALGTPQYMSPEQITSKKTINSSTDIYSLGVLLYEMLVGKTPYAGLDFVAVVQKHVKEPVPTLPEVFAKYQPLLNAMMQKKRKLRIQNASALFEYLGHFVTEENTSHTLQHDDDTGAYEDPIYATHTIGEHSQDDVKHPHDAETSFRQFTYQQNHDTSHTHQERLWKRIIGYILGHNIAFISFVGVGFLSLVLIAIHYGDPFADSVPPLNAKADMLAAAGALKNARSLIKEGKILPPDTSNALHQLEYAVAAEPSNQALNDDLVDMLIYALDRYMAQDALDFPAGANALAMSKKLQEHTPKSVWQPYKKEVLQHLLKRTPGDSQAKQDKHLAYAIELLQLQRDNKVAHVAFAEQVAMRKKNAYRLAAATQYEKAATIAQLLYKITTKQEYQLLYEDWKRRAMRSGLQEYAGVLVPIEGNCYTMGSNKNSVWHRTNEMESEQCVGDFAMSQYEVTVGQYQRYCNEVQCRLGNALSEQGSGKPITHLSWQEVQKYIAWLNNKTDDYHFSLPTEQEWEYAARANTNIEQQFYWGDSMKTGLANCSDCGSATGGLRSSVVGTFPDNPFNLYDMLGNVWEWTCSDYTKHVAPTTPTTQQPCSTDDIQAKTIRGGSWFSDAGDTRIAVRYGLLPENKTYDLGFRLVRRVAGTP